MATVECPHCKNFRGRPHELLEHLIDQGFGVEEAKGIVDELWEEWNEKLRQDIEQEFGLGSLYYDEEEEKGNS